MTNPTTPLGPTVDCAECPRPIELRGDGEPFVVTADLTPAGRPQIGRDGKLALVRMHATCRWPAVSRPSAPAAVEPTAAKPAPAAVGQTAFELVG